jgi:hypothetical protein
MPKTFASALPKATAGKLRGAALRWIFPTFAYSIGNTHLRAAQVSCRHSIMKEREKSLLLSLLLSLQRVAVWFACL